MTTMTATIGGEPDLVSILQAYNDVTDRLKLSHERLAQEVCRLREELHEKNKELQRRARLASLGQMAAGVAHEIRNPLGGIGLYASLLERDLVDRPKQRDVVRKMSAGIRNLEGIVRDILAFAGDAHTEAAPVSLASVVEDVMAQVAPEAESAGVTIEVDPGVGDWVLMADAPQIERALINLVLNALDAAPTGGRVWIRVGRRLDDPAALRIVVEDNGPGIDPTILQRVFDPFFTTRDSGTGLGLAIVHRIAESNGGSVSASQRLGGGAMFVLTVPLAAEAIQQETTGGIE